VPELKSCPDTVIDRCQLNLLKKTQKSFPLFFFASFVYPVAPEDGTGAALREIFMVLSEP